MAKLQLVGEISPHLNEDCRKYLEESEKYTGANESKSTWGSHVKCKVPEGFNHDFSLLSVLMLYGAVKILLIYHFIGSFSITSIGKQVSSYILDEV